MSPQDLKHVLQTGLLSFPLTDFDSELRFAPKAYAERLEWLQPYGASVLFAAGGTGEFFSLEPQEFSEVIEVALETCRGRTPIVAGAGGGTTLAIKYAQEAERLGAQGILLLPHYLTEGSQPGLIAHVEAVCNSVKIGVIIYNRGACRLTPASLLVLAERCPNLVGFKDGVGDIEKFVAIRQTLGERFSILIMWGRWRNLYRKTIAELGLQYRCASVRSIGAKIWLTRPSNALRCSAVRGAGSMARTRPRRMT